MRTSIRKRTIFILASLVVITWLAASWVMQIQASPVTSELPAVAKLTPRQSAPAAPIETESFCLASGNILEQAGDVRVQAGNLVMTADSGTAYCVYETGPYVPADQLESIAVTTQWIGDAQLEYQVGIADFATGEWHMSPMVDRGKTRSIEIPQVGNPLSDDGRMYLAIKVPPHAAVNVERVDIAFNLAREEAVKIDSEMLEREIINVPVAVPLIARDINGRIADSYNGELTITADNGTAQLTCLAEFHDGRARPAMTFSEQGTYSLAVTGTEGPLAGPLGTMALYDTQLPVYSLQVDPDVMAELNANLFSDQYLPGELRVDDSEWNKALVRYRGCSRRMADKRSWKVKLNGKHALADSEWGYDRESLNLITDPTDTTMLREKLSYDLMRDMGVPAPRTRFIHLRVNDVFQGLYMDVENPRKQWLTAMGFDNDGPLYKAAPGNLGRLSKVSEYEERYEKKTNTDEAYSDLAELCANLDDIRDENDDRVESSLDDLFFMDHLTNYIVALTLVSARENWMHNYYLYHEEDKSGKWLIFPWDMDMTWSFDSPGQLSADDPLDMRVGTNVLTSIYFQNQKLMAVYRERLAQAVEGVFAPERMTERIDEYYAEIGPDVIADWQKKGTNEEYPRHVEGLKRYVEDRCDFIRQEIEKS